MNFMRVYFDDLDKELEYGEVILLALIRSLSESEDGCYASNKYFADTLNCSERTINRWLKKLLSKGYVSVDYVGRNKLLNVNETYDICVNKPTT